MGSHSSRRCIAAPLKQPTRAARGRNTPGRIPEIHQEPYPASAPIRSCSGWGLPCRKPLLATRCALTAPFQCYLAKAVGNLLSVALSLGSPPPGVTRHPCFVEPGLSSRHVHDPRLPDPLARQPLARPMQQSKSAWQLRVATPIACHLLSCATSYRVRPASRSSNSDNSNARHSPSIIPSMAWVRQRRWKAVVAARPSVIS